MTFAQEERQAKLRQILSSIIQACRAGFDVDEEKLIATIGSEQGAARRTALEYLKQLEFTKHIIRKDGKIWDRESYEAEKVLKKAALNPEGANGKL